MNNFISSISDRNINCNQLNWMSTANLVFPGILSINGIFINTSTQWRRYHQSGRCHFQIWQIYTNQTMMIIKFQKNEMGKKERAMWYHKCRANLSFLFALSVTLEMHTPYILWMKTTAAMHIMHTSNLILENYLLLTYSMRY